LHSVKLLTVAVNYLIAVYDVLFLVSN
jgi:hypothetical protein